MKYFTKGGLVIYNGQGDISEIMKHIAPVTQKAALPKAKESTQSLKK